MAINRFQPLIWPELANIERFKENPYRAQTILQIRNSIKPDLTVIDSPDKRIELVIRFWMRESPIFRDLFADAIYNDPDFFRKLNLTSPDTILRDNRELEERGYFQKK